MRIALFVAWVALIGADRIDLLGGAGPVRLTPFLVLTPLLLGVELVRMLRDRERLPLSASAGGYTLAVSLLLAVTLLSVFFSYDAALSAKRFGLLIVQVYATLAAAVLLLRNPERERILVQGAYLGIALAVVFNIAQLISWFMGLIGRGDGSQIDAFIFISPWSYGDLIPRLSGQVLDMNRGGMLLVIYMFLLMRFGEASGKRRAFMTVAILSVLVTVSRSAVAAMFVMGLFFYLQEGTVRLEARFLARAAAAGALSMLVLILFPGILAASTETLLPPLLLRVLGDGSSSVHFELLRHGMELGTSSFRNALIGIGFGSSYTVLGEFFPDNEYANYHSLYVSLLAETGVFSLVLGLVLLGLPFFRSARYRPIIAGLIAFSVFYQTTLEPVFWFVLAAAWLELRPARAVQPSAVPLEPIHA